MAPQPNTIPSPDDLPASAESVAAGKDLHQDRSSSLRCRRCVLTPALTRRRLHGGRESAKPQVANDLTQPHPFRDDNGEAVAARRLLVATGRRTDLAALGVAAVGLGEDARGIDVDERMRAA